MTKMHSVFIAGTFQRGRTLIELMVTIALGLLLSAIILSVYLALRQNNRVVDSNSLLQDTARFAQQIIARQIRHAGYLSYVSGGPANVIRSDWSATSGIAPPYVQGCVGSMTNPILSANVVCAAGVGDVLQVASGGTDSIDYVPATGEGGDCLGQSPPAAYNYNISRFFVAVNSNTGVSELYCLGSGNAATPQPIASGIEQIVVWYGRSADDKGTVTRWDRASALAVADWSTVIAARVCLIAATDQNGVVTSTASYTYNDCFGVVRKGSPLAADPNAPSTEGKARRAYWMTIAMRNVSRGNLGYLQNQTAPTP